MKKQLGGVSKAARPTAFLKRRVAAAAALRPEDRRQEQEIGRVHPALRIGDTVFTTITADRAVLDEASPGIQKKIITAVTASARTSTGKLSFFLEKAET